MSHKNYLLLACLICTLSCKKADVASDDEDRNAIFVYIAANNDLKYSAIRSVDQMEKAYRREDGDLIVFVKTDRFSSYILKIKPDNNEGVIASDTLKTYKSQNSSSLDFMREAFKDMSSFTSAKRYGLIMWSHATSWLPESKRVPTTKSFGYDRGEEMDLKDLKTALPKNLKFILFDACYMASVEVVYELRKNADYIIASSSEVLNTSYPYDLILGDLFSGNLTKVCQKFYDYYNSKTGIKQSGTVSLIDTEYLEDLAFETRRVFKKSDRRDINSLSGVAQDFNFVKSIDLGLYDFWSLIRNNYAQIGLVELESALNKCVVYKAHTEYFLNFPIIESSGLTLSLINQPWLLDYYTTLDWYIDSGMDNIY
ncbi:clostripain-related cysteine peptidase [Sphingobacterium deserti]|nr:clostripain-related cysteine peptidase [Sphingobacterium deserti]